MFHKLIGLPKEVWFKSRKMSTIQFLKSHSGDSIAYEKVIGDKSLPTLMYVPGYGSGKDGDKAKYLKGVAAELGCGFVRYDPVGQPRGESTDKPFESMEFQDWLENGEEILDRVSDEKTILIGSSMGGWISLLLAQNPKFKEKIKGMILISPALNFFMKYYGYLCSQLPKDAVERIEKGETYLFTDSYGNTRPIRKSFFENTVQFENTGEIGVDVPVIILHGVKDETVPYRSSLDIIENITSKDVELTYLKESAHRFQDDDALGVLKDRVMKMLEKTKY